MRVMKFGGSSLAEASRLARVAELIESTARTTPVAVVVSAMGGVTDALLETVALAEGGDSAWRIHLEEILHRHHRAIGELEMTGDLEAPRAIGEVLTEIGEVLHGIELIGELTPRSRDLVLSAGERCSAPLLAALLRHRGLDAEVLDAREVLRTDDRFGAATCDLELTGVQLRRHFSQVSAIQVMTGFIGATAEGRTTTIGRGGSDASAAILGVGLGAELIELWTDVDGVASADPRVVPDAFVHSEISYVELAELSHFGAKVVHPASVHPARDAGIPLSIRNTFNPDHPGTRIVDEPSPSPALVRGLSSIPRIALLRLEGDGMVGVPGVAARLFATLAAAEVNVVMISQASSEHSICFAVTPDDVPAARRSVEAAFNLEHKAGLVDELVIEDDAAILAVVGERMREVPGISGRLFSVLGKAQVNVRAIAQGSSERNISLVIDRDAVRAASLAVHDEFFSSSRRAKPRVGILVAGCGRVGGALVDQILASSELGVELLGLARSQHFLASPITTDWRARLAEAPAGSDERLLAAFDDFDGLRLLVDCSASESLAQLSMQVLEVGAGVVAANKRLPGGDQGRWDRFEARAQELGLPAFFETTAGAALPVLSSIRSLRSAGDEIVSIEAALSGTLNLILEGLMRGEALSKLTRMAHSEGFTEPHPAEDLSGLDVLRKAVVLSRACGHRLEPEAVELESLVDQATSELGLEDFFSHLETLDSPFKERAETALAKGTRLRYLARLSAQGATVGPVAVGPEHPAYHLEGADSMVIIHSLRWPRPLVISGPGAGLELTAAGVLSDILQAAREYAGASR